MVLICVEQMFSFTRSEALKIESFMFVCFPLTYKISASVV